MVKVRWVTDDGPGRAKNARFHGKGRRDGKVGDKVQWQASQGTVRGTVRQVLTSPTDIKGHHVAASPDNPEYLVVSDKTAAEAAHKPNALTRV